MHREGVQFPVESALLCFVHCSAELISTGGSPLFLISFSLVESHASSLDPYCFERLIPGL